MHASLGTPVCDNRQTGWIVGGIGHVIAVGYIYAFIINTASAALVSTRYSAILFLSHLDFGSKTFFYMLAGSTTLLSSLSSRWTEHCWKLDCFKKQIGACYQVQSISGLLRDHSKDDLENNRRAAKNSDFVRVIGFFNPPLRVRTDIYAINDLFGLWTRYKIGINLNYSDTSHFAHAHGTS